MTMPSRVVRGPTVWDWLIAALAVVSVLALPTSVLRAVTTVADQPDGVNLALAVVYVA